MGAITHQLLVGYSEEWRTRVSCLCPTEMSSSLDPEERESVNSLSLKGPNLLTISFSSTACMDFVQPLFLLHISVMLNKQAIGIMNTAMNVTLTNVSV